MLEFQASATKSRKMYTSNQNLFIYSKICGESIVYGENKQILRIVSMEKSGLWNIVFQEPIYLPMKKKYEFEIYIKDANNEDASFLQSPT